MTSPSASSRFPLPAIVAFFERARAAGATTILNPAPARECGADLLDLVDILVLNESELAFLTAKELYDNDDPARFIEAARSLGGREKIICVTLGSRGVLALIDGAPMRIPAGRSKPWTPPAPAIALSAHWPPSLRSGTTIPYALNYANAAASICVQRMGAGPSMPTAAEVEARRCAGKSTSASRTAAAATASIRGSA